MSMISRALIIFLLLAALSITATQAQQQIAPDQVADTIVGRNLDAPVNKLSVLRRNA